ncbi:UTP:RNA uridylyltransferase [Actinidia chinensis var. chinensis]|uniref:RNA uridylyltransferase n=1 Tax=Actinidia chinensis var. chinensis TaxID=1590841 RepID=A0A2R6QS90_ACTCC|nr:UTP:RNA uridylyltransferase [Actinidia chinensis var. chinensis]
MSGGGRDQKTPPYPQANGGEFLLQLLRKPSHQPPAPPPPHPPQPPSASASAPAQNLSHDPAVAAVGPTLSLPPFPSNGHDLPYHPPVAPHNYFLQNFPQNSNPNPNSNHSWSPSPSDFNRNHSHNLQFGQFLADDVQKLGLSGSNSRPEPVHQHEQNLLFGSFPCKIRSNEGLPDGNMNKNLASTAKVGEGSRRLNGLEVTFQNSSNFSPNLRENSHTFRNQEHDHRSGQQQSVNLRRPPPGFPIKPSNLGHWETGNKSFENNVDKGKSSFGELRSNHEDERAKRLSQEHGKIRGDRMMGKQRLSSQLDCPGPPAGSDLHSVSASDIEESLLALHAEIGEDGEKSRYRLQGNTRSGGVLVRSEGDDFDEYLTGSSVLKDGSEKNDRKQHQSSRDKDYRSDTRGQRLLGQRMRNFKRQIECRFDINRLNAPFLAIYESLIPPEEEKGNRKQLLTLLEKLVSKEWPEAQLFLYGSCANSFGVSKSDIDVCLAIEDPDVNKSDVLLKLADILQSDNLQNVQALTRARVPIVKLKDPVTGISCDICINNVLAVVNTKLLRDYAKIDVRLQQLAFIVKHWAKSRRVNETFKGTLSSYAYVLMCIHFLQQRKPAILPCLQGMERTYVVNVDNIECAYFDQVEKLSGFGSPNRESIAQLVWAFFNYWAYCHDYANDVISVRTGSMLSKRVKDWTRRIGNDRHLICIEDPFETSHDLGRVVDKYSIKVLREEFERAAEIMQHDPNPCVKLFDPYIPS